MEGYVRYAEGEQSLPAWGVWIEMLELSAVLCDSKSLPAWGVWIEITMNVGDYFTEEVTPRMGSVD